MKSDGLDQDQTARSVQSDLDLLCPQKIIKPKREQRSRLGQGQNLWPFKVIQVTKSIRGWEYLFALDTQFLSFIYMPHCLPSGLTYFAVDVRIKQTQGVYFFFIRFVILIAKGAVTP